MSELPQSSRPVTWVVGDDISIHVDIKTIVVSLPDEYGVMHVPLRLSMQGLLDDMRDGVVRRLCESTKIREKIGGILSTNFDASMVEGAHDVADLSPGEPTCIACLAMLPSTGDQR